MKHEGEYLKIVQNHVLSGLNHWLGFALINHKREYIFVNEKFIEMCGYRKDEILGSTNDLLDSGLQDEKVRNWDVEAVNVSREWEGILGYRNKSGNLYWNLVKRIPIYNFETSNDSQKRLYLELHLDQSEFMRQKSLVEKQNVLAQASAHFSILGQMIGGITHEINNPLTVILGTAKYIKMTFDKDELTSELVDKSTKKIMDAATRISKVTKIAKSLSRDSSEDPFVVHSISALFEELNTLIGTRVRNHGIVLDFEMTHNDATISCRPAELLQALLNLIYNSDTAVRDTEAPWIKVLYEVDEHHHTFKVIDSGKGLPPEIEGIMMKPFVTTKKLGTGMGMGLGLTKTIVESHSGTLSFNKDCKNTCFVIQIPKYETKPVN